MEEITLILFFYFPAIFFYFKNNSIDLHTKVCTKYLNSRTILLMNYSNLLNRLRQIFEQMYSFVRLMHTALNRMSVLKFEM